MKKVRKIRKVNRTILSIYTTNKYFTISQIDINKYLHIHPYQYPMPPPWPLVTALKWWWKFTLNFPLLLNNVTQVSDHMHYYILMLEPSKIYKKSPSFSRKLWALLPVACFWNLIYESLKIELTSHKINKIIIMKRKRKTTKKGIIHLSNFYCFRQSLSLASKRLIPLNERSS